MNLNRIVAGVLFVISLALAGYLYSSISGTIQEQESIATKEAQVIERLKLIREAEIVYQETHGRYTASWDTLVNFIETGSYYVIQRTEKIIPLSYGVDSIQVFIDTIDVIPARERIFKRNFTINAADNGTLVKWHVKVGDRVVRTQKAYSLRTANGEVRDHPFREDGTVSQLANVPEGSPVSKGQNLITFWDYQFDPNIDVKTMAFIPYLENTRFDIFVSKVDKNGVLVDVIEVKDPSPADPNRKESNDAKNRKPLRFGSRLDVTTAGNWE